MPTSDGISDAEWDVVRFHSESIVDADSNDIESGILVRRLLDELDKLKNKYGRLPSILGTEADYVDDEIAQLSLLKEAFVSASEMSDAANKVYIATSLVEFYLSSGEVCRVKFWSEKLEFCLAEFSDSYAESVLADVSTFMEPHKSE